MSSVDGFKLAVSMNSEKSCLWEMCPFDDTFVKCFFLLQSEKKKIPHGVSCYFK